MSIRKFRSHVAAAKRITPENESETFRILRTQDRQRRMVVSARVISASQSFATLTLCALLRCRNADSA